MMEHITVGRKYNEGKIANIDCVKNGSLKNIDIKNKCFLLIFLLCGQLSFKTDNDTVSAEGPCFICFNEKENIEFINKRKAEYYCIYFHPDFLNINMTFEFLRASNYSDIATNHDMFMLKPFLDEHHVIPICDNYFISVNTACVNMKAELDEQRDWYWSCRGRSYFMEIIIALERMYGLIGYGENDKNADTAPSINNPKLRDAVLYVEGHYSENLKLKDISNKTGINITTLTKLMKEETGFTATEYLMQYRIKVAKKQLAFTDVPLKDIALRTGFKTVQHFSRVFKEHTNITPAEFRRISVQKRKDEIT